MESISLYSKIRDSFIYLINVGNSIDEEYAKFTQAQMHFFSSRIQSLTLLLQHGQLWDADILMRSAIECATRFLFVSTRNFTERSKYLHELNVDLFEIHLVERSDKANTAALHAADPDDSLIFRGAALTKEQELELRARWPKSKRKPMKQKWSFSEIVSELERIKEPTLDLSAYSSLQYSYALGSHFVHADRTAILLVQDRESREQEEKFLLKRAHFARLAVEPTTLFYICLRGMAHSLQVQIDMSDIGEGVVDLYAKSRQYHQDFFASQANLYNLTGTS